MMKIIPILTFIAMFGGLLCANPPLGHSEYDDIGSEYGVPQDMNHPGVPDSDADLVSLSTSKIRSRVKELEQKVRNLEQENRFLDERIRQLDRVVDDLRRRR